MLTVKDNCLFSGASIVSEVADAALKKHLTVFITVHVTQQRSSAHIRKTYQYLRFKLWIRVSTHTFCNILFFISKCKTHLFVGFDSNYQIKTFVQDITAQKAGNAIIPNLLT